MTFGDFLNHEGTRNDAKKARLIHEFLIYMVCVSLRTIQITHHSYLITR